MGASRKLLPEAATCYKSINGRVLFSVIGRLPVITVKWLNRNACYVRPVQAIQVDAVPLGIRPGHVE